MHAEGTPASWGDLPRELRDMVYPHLWEGIAPVRPATGYSRRDAFEVHYGQFKHYDGRMSGLPRWLLTSKQILREGLEQFNKHATWVCHANVCDKVDDQYSSLIGPSVATNLILAITLDHKIVLTNPDPMARKLKQPYQLLASLVPKLRREMRFLTLDVSLDDQPTIGFLKNPPWHIDLSLFDRLDLQLDSITDGSRQSKAFLVASPVRSRRRTEPRWSEARRSGRHRQASKIYWYRE
ncbi:hypothetical protein C7974DRAFT_454694 [Boeremia exigua]|uniref:uncharacterized protein n=1 Tax=Boeremia exigua TaxID=749465 RepID=UPI001E8E64D8|nr:uncharacterized protein C7974DRAFT_454694 [Boeremia exigua]KAH6629774.1 hypothetical protein C7974DRAFT_454694 [Boeremia exigua]